MELLAPAGNFETLAAAVQSGADAVYIGGAEFSARRSAANFSMPEISEAAKYCHIYGVKLHVAANILIKETEKDKFVNYIGALNEAGVDAVIIQDIGMASLVHKMFPDLPLHASTQMTVTNVSGAKKMKEIGFSRVVLARELSKSAIEKIIKSVDIEVEVFCHGAICMCYSGQCLLSSMIGGRSGNRGMCAQPCRLPYELDGNPKYYLSPKDMSLAERLSELSEIGVASLKIEGRLKRKEYVSAVCGIYRKYIDSKGKITKEDKKELLDAFNRSGFTSGYFDDELGKGMMSLNNPSNISENIFSEEAKKRAEQGANLRKIKVYMSAELHFGEPLTVNIWDNEGHFAAHTGTKTAEKAENVALGSERLKAQLLKLGNTPFTAEECEIIIDENITVAISEINEVRRTACEKFKEELARLPERRSVKQELYALPEYKNAPIITCEVQNYEQAKAVIERGITRIYADTKLANRLFEEFPKLEIVAKMPPVSRDDREYIKPKTKAILISNIGQLDENKECFGDFRLNITNAESVGFYNKLKTVTLSPELTIYELSKISAGAEVIAYGRLGLMIMENCPLKANGRCQKGKAERYLKDRKNESFYTICREGCVLEMINSKPVYMADKAEDLKKLSLASVRLIFTVENSEICGKIVDEYNSAFFGNGKITMPDGNSITRGHFYHGVE